MVKKFCLTLAVISTALISLVSAQQTAKVTASGIGYLEYLPQGYKSNSNKYPLVISLHGIKEKGTASTDRKKILADLAKVDNVGLPKYVKNGTKYPFILISPQLKSNYGSWPASYVIQVLNDVKKHLRVDERRIYLTGLSLGGFGVWKTAGEYPDVFAAIAPICPGGNALSKADEIAAKNVAAWGFHGSKDKVVSYTVTTKMINAMNTAPKKPKPLAKATIFPGMGHIIWDKAYNQTNLLDWMLSHRKGSPPPAGDKDGNAGNDKGDSKNDDKGKDKPSAKNKVPSAYAGPDRVLTLPTNSITINAQATDSDGKIASYQWTQTYGKNASMSGTGTSRVRIYNLKEGPHIFRLRVRDNDGAVKDDYFKITVKKAPGKTTGKPANDKPTEPANNKSNSKPYADAGPDRVLHWPSNALTIKGKASDKDGKIVSYEWTKTQGPAAGVGGARTPNVHIHHMQKGTYVFRLRVKDNDGAVKDDFLKITVKG